MNSFSYDEEPVKVTRDSGYSKLKLISPENRKKLVKMHIIRIL